MARCLRYIRKNSVIVGHQVDFKMQYMKAKQSILFKKGNTTQECLNTCAKGLTAFLLILLLWTTNCLAEQITLAWDPSESNGTNLIGYNLYYKAGSSAAADPDIADLIYIDISDPDFDPDHPSYQVTGLSDSERYYFVVSAMYNDGESGMSNEVSSIVGAGGEQNSSINASTDDTSAGSSSGGCFIDSLR